LPNVERIAQAQAARTIFTRFVPAARPEDASGTWRRYWERWRSMTLERLAPDLVDLAPSLQRLVPPAIVVDKRVYSPWLDTELDAILRQRGASTLIVTGAETDVCVLASVIGAVDRGYRVIIVVDAVCSSSDETHDALLTLYAQRYSQQVENVVTSELLAAWPRQ
jgi:nicotinamidase-related amidase